MLPTHAVFCKIADPQLPAEKSRHEERDRYPNIGSLGEQRSKYYKERMESSYSAVSIFLKIQH